MANIRKIRRELKRMQLFLSGNEYRALKRSLCMMTIRRRVPNVAIAAAFRPIILQARQDEQNEQRRAVAIVHRIGLKLKGSEVMLRGRGRTSRRVATPRPG